MPDVDRPLVGLFIVLDTWRRVAGGYGSPLPPVAAIRAVIVNTDSGQPESDPRGSTSRSHERRGRRAVVLSPRELPADLQRRIRGEVVSGRMSASVLYHRHDLASLGINPSTFRKYVAAIRRAAPLPRKTPTLSARIEATARALVAFLEVTYTTKGSTGIIAALAKDRLGKMPAGPLGKRSRHGRHRWHVVWMRFSLYRSIGPKLTGSFARCVDGGSTGGNRVMSAC